MKLSLLLATCLLLIVFYAQAQKNPCFNQVSLFIHQCDTSKVKKLTNCQPRLMHEGGIEHKALIHNALESYAHTHLIHSFQHLEMGLKFNNFLEQREGLAKLFRKLSDDTWDDAIDIIKYMAQRGSKTDMRKLKNVINDNGLLGDSTKPIILSEIDSLSLALDMTKSLFEKANHNHMEMSRKSDKIHDASAMHYIEEKFLEKQSKLIRELSGHVHDLASLMKSNCTKEFSVFMFDEHLKSMY